MRNGATLVGDKCSDHCAIAKTQQEVFFCVAKSHFLLHFLSFLPHVTPLEGSLVLLELQKLRRGGEDYSGTARGCTPEGGRPRSRPKTTEKRSVERKGRVVELGCSQSSSTKRDGLDRRCDGLMRLQARRELS